MGIRVEVVSSIKPGKKPDLIEWVAGKAYRLGQAPREFPKNIAPPPIQVNCKGSKWQFDDSCMHSVGVNVDGKRITMGSFQPNGNNAGGLVSDPENKSGFIQLTEPIIFAREGFIVKLEPLPGTACQREQETRTIK